MGGGRLGAQSVKWFSLAESMLPGSWDQVICLQVVRNLTPVVSTK